MAAALLPQARRAFDTVSAYWPLLTPAEAACVRRWLDALEDDVDPEAAPRRIARGSLRFQFPGGVAALLPERILRSATHPYLQQAVALGVDGIAPWLREQMAHDLRCWQAVQALMPREDGASPPPAGSAGGDPFALRQTPWSAAPDRAGLLAAFAVRTDWATLVDDVGAFVARYGLGAEQGCVAFRLGADGPRARLEPIEHFSAFDLSWLEGNASRIAVLEDNTRHLLAGFRAHNTLIWGPRGCGKSSLIRGLITRYWDRGLRGIEVPAARYGQLPQLFDLVRSRPERFIAVLDNIALDRADPSTRLLSSVLDGGLESAPRNLVFYATSNFKDLVDRAGERPQGPPPNQADEAPGELRHTDSQATIRRGFDPQGFQRLDERRALDDRFALKVFVDLPTKSEYDRLVVAYARRAGIDRSEAELLARFQVWRMRNNHDLVGGRTARDFVLSCYPDETRGLAADAG